jgi:hypothetical protein
VVPLVADLGRHAAGGAPRIARLGAAGGHRLRVAAARALWLVCGDAEPAWALLRPVLAPLAAGRVSPAAVRAAAVAGQLPDPPADLVGTLRAVVTGDRRYSCYGDWRAVTDDDELARLAAVVCR